MGDGEIIFLVDALALSIVIALAASPKVSEFPYQSTLKYSTLKP